MMKILRIFQSVVVALIIQNSANALNLEFLTRIKIPDEIVVLPDTQHVYSKSNGAFIWTIQHRIKPPGDIGQFGIAVKTNLQYFYFRPQYISQARETNSFILPIGPGDGGGNLAKSGGGKQQIFENITTTKLHQNSEMILKTLSAKGVLIYEEVEVEQELNEWEFYQNTIKYIRSSFGGRNKTKRIIKYDSLGSPVLTNYLDSNSVININTGFNRYNVPDDSIENKTIVNSILSDEPSGKYVSFYRLSDPDLLSSQNRITLGSSQNGSITATVNNPEQAILNIQSSTNLIDWNTFKTIQNEPSLEIVVPANKPKEFIRAIE